MTLQNEFGLNWLNIYIYIVWHKQKESYSKSMQAFRQVKCLQHLLMCSLPPYYNILNAGIRVHALCTVCPDQVRTYC